MRFSAVSTILITLSLFATPCHALTGEQLLDGLRAQEDPRRQYTFEAGLAIGFVSGTANTALSLGAICPSTVISTNQMIAVARKHIEDRPSYWNLPAEGLVFAALRDAFPCQSLQQ